ncbi:MAG: SDR family NAD(P)-dependent oxidoreductase, partial [Desulfobacterales bacterium]|nr:SDR family NAD(P)-dependent oxidoreductase [Desulfobacterales bacterium]
LRRAGISSFGATGSNAHIILEEYTAENEESTQLETSQPVLIPISAKTPEGLQIYITKILNYLKTEKERIDLTSLAFTLQTGRVPMEERFILLAHNLKEAIKLLQSFVEGDDLPNIWVGQVKPNTQAMRLFDSDIDLKGALQQWILKGKLNKIAELWTQGYQMDWGVLYQDKLPKRISLPSYPFTKVRYWIQESKNKSSKDTETTMGISSKMLPPVNSTIESITKETDIYSGDEMTFISKWEEQLMISSDNSGNHKLVLIVCQESSFQFETTIQKYYQQNGDTKTILLRLGNQTKQVSESEWFCDVKDTKTFVTCLQKIDIVDCIYFLSLSQEGSNSVDLDTLIQSQQANEVQLLRLIKFLKQNYKINTSVDCYILTLDKFNVGADLIIPFGGGITGLAYSIAQGNHQFLVRNLDLSSENLADYYQREALLQQVLKEPASNRGDVIKIKSKIRYKQKFYKLNPGDINDQSGIKYNGVYVILGGSGNVGQAITRHLIQRYQAKVVWIGRTPETSQVVQKKIESFQGLEKSLLYIQADVTKLDSMNQAVSKIKKKYSKINGAIFSGVVFNSENSIEETIETEFQSILDIKVNGSLNFHTVFKEEPLDFMCYFSSIQSFQFTSAIKTCGYAAGITYADSLVKSLESKSHFPIGIINWGYWENSVVDPEFGKLLQNKFGLISDHEGFNCFETFISLLKERTLNQITCVKAFEPVRKVMNCSEKEVITICKPMAHSIIHSLKESIKIKIPKTDDYRDKLNSHIIKLLFLQIQSLGIFSKKNIFEENELIWKDSGIIDKYYLWWNECCLEMLESEGYIKNESGLIKVLKEVKNEKEEGVWESWKSIKKLYFNNSQHRALLTLLDSCLQKLPEILKGEIPATDVVFPKSSMEKVEGIYKNNAIADYFNMILANLVVTYIEERIKSDPGASLRIIEIGAGTGGTTEVVLSKIRKYVSNIKEYCYTDISKAFLMHAEKHYAPDNPFLSYKLWNVELPLADQGFEVGEFDLVIATNVLHATKNIRQTLRNAKAVLHGNGLLLLNEIKDKSNFTSLTFGLLDGWWLSEDKNLRIPGNPGLYPESWNRILKEEGFNSVLFPTKNVNQLGQQIIVAQSNGVVRYVQQEKKNIEKKVSSISPLTHEKSSICNSEEPSINVKEYVKNLIIDCLSDTLKMSKVNIDNDEVFLTYGIDSILSVGFIDKVNDLLSISLNTAIVFDYSTVNNLTNYVIKTYKEKIKIKEKYPNRIFKQVHNKKSKHIEKVEVKKIREKTRKYDSSLPKEANNDQFKSPDIAVIGISGQFPKANNVNDFWKNLIEGLDGVVELPSSYLDQERFFSPQKQQGKSYCKWGGILEGRECFDPLFFNLSPREAESMNPHQRLILQESWKALEDAGYNPKTLAGSQVAIYVGAEPTGYINESFTGSSEAIIASRLSYFLNFMGPAMVVNTGCSSSAVAVHLACENLRAEKSHIAIAGGVNATMSKDAYVNLSKIDMLSPTGRCHTFDERADGTIMSEGAAVVVLKRLEEALVDADPIYGVICGSGINQDGASNGITAPNGLSQEQLIKDIYQLYKINPEEISYIEAHGTGTKLGDPVEANALVRAFKQFTSKKEYCAVGSAKSHIGHTSAAAGVIGLIKILLSMQYRKLPALLNFTKLNPMIEFEDSPFYINTQPVEWKARNHEPLMAALNSFGHSGTNAHIVVREHFDASISQDDLGLSNENPMLIPLSAKTVESLKVYIEELSQFLFKQTSEDSINQRQCKIDLSEIAYTLQTGRESMECRAIFLSRNIAELSSQLQLFIEEKKNIPNCWKGQVEDQDNGFTLFSSDEDTYEIITKWISKSKFEKIAESWSHGFEVEWSLLYDEKKPKRISLPTYPFAKEQYWISEKENKIKPHINCGDSVSAIHPLLHRNTSDLSKQRFSSTFSGNEFFLHDHQVKGQKILPGVAYLEMAIIAINQAIGDSDELVEIHLNNIVWVRSISINNHAKDVHIGLYPEKDNLIQFEIYSDPENKQEESIVHAQGICELKAVSQNQSLNLTSLRSEMNRGILTSDECYQSFKTLGIDYGEEFQGLEEIYLGNGQVLAKLSLPSSILETKDQYTLHPCLMDSALQSSIGLMMDDETDSSISLKLSLPFALQKLEVLGSCTGTMYAWLRYSASSISDKVQIVDIDMCDDDGNVCVKITGFSSRTLEEANYIPSEEIGTLMTYPVWKTESVVPKGMIQADYSKHFILLCEIEGISKSDIENHIERSSCNILKSEEKNIESRFQEYGIQVFSFIKEILQKNPKKSQFLQLVVTGDDDGLFFSGLSGLLKTAALENPKFKGQLIIISSGETKKGLVEKLKANCGATQDIEIQYINNNRQILSLKEISISKEYVVSPWANNGVYLITGGLGGLGFIFAHEITKKIQTGTLILTGRSSISENMQAKLKILRESGNRIEYRQVDVSEKDEVKDLIQNIDDKYGLLNGIIHSAGVTFDNFIFKKSIKEFKQVLAPKVSGTINLDEATKDQNLDFFVLFSSGASVLGNIGQADYAIANAFMDRFAYSRNEKVLLNKRSGQTLAFNWLLWKEGGMKVDISAEKMMTRNTGMIPMKSNSGIQAFYEGLISKHGQLMVMEGELKQMRSLYIKKSYIQDQRNNTVKPQTVNQSPLKEKVVELLKRLLASSLKLPINRVNSTAPLEKYGIDSILAMELTNQLEKTFGSLSKTLFFEYQTIDELTQYFMESYEDKLHELLHVDESSTTEVELIEKHKSRKTISKPNKDRNRFVSFKKDFTKSKSKKNIDIAIIGISGRYPQSENLEEYWNNLQNGVDCIIEIPNDRWDWRQYYSEDRNQSGVHFSKWGGFIKGVNEFDPLFFNISPREAEIVDPQERLFLEHVWMAVEDAGYTRETLKGKKGAGQIGVYTGVMHGEYQLFGAEESLQGNRIGLSSSYGSISNRVSYVMNLNGPSMTVDTMCSSSLTAIHLACQDLMLERTTLGIAGGVNLSIHPNKYLMLSAGQFISSKGHCESFGEGGDGYIPGEGVGVVLLKRLFDAQRDNDQIYGVIKGSSINHGGKTNGYTVPNPKAQQAAIEQTLHESGVNPRTVSYIEAHGTGTKLGDPIEIAALTKAFQKSTEETGFCMIGSAKSNIGHCESAAGIAGLTKVLLQMRYKKIVPSLHSTTLNPYIDFKKTPFVVNQTLQDWSCPVINGKEASRIAGISSFGAGGSNAHLIIEEYKGNSNDIVPLEVIQTNRFLIPLSAKNRDRLHELANNLLEFVRKVSSAKSVNEPKLNIANLSYTLQTGREAMEERLGLIVDSLDELEKKLEGFIEGKEGIEDLFRGQVKLNEDTISIFTADEDLQNTIDIWFSKNKYIKLIDLWVKGLELDWNKLYNDNKPKRISLPTYPFAKEQYWVPKSENKIKTAISALAIHPLLHRNTSDLSEQRYSSTFTGDEFFLNDHQVKGQKVLPGVAYLEMARAAINLAMGASDELVEIHLNNIVWIRSISINNHAKDVHIGLYPEKGNLIEFEIYSDPENKQDESIVHAKGICELKAVSQNQSLNLTSLRSEMNRGILTPDECYQSFKALGIDYGDGHQGLEEIYLGNKQVLAKLFLPSSILKTKDQYTLHPCLMDSALQASIGLMDDETGSSIPLKLPLPFALQKLEVLGLCTETMYAWLRYSKGSMPSDKVQKIDIDMCDLDGNVCVRMTGFSSRTQEEENYLQFKEIGTLMAYPVWKTEPASTPVSMNQTGYTKHFVVLCDFKGFSKSFIEKQIEGSSCHILKSEEINIESRFQDYAIQVFAFIKEIFQKKLKGNQLLQVVVPENDEYVFLGLSGLLKTAGLENPNFKGQLISISTGEAKDSIVEKLKANCASPQNLEIRYINNNRQILSFKEFSVIEKSTILPWKENGIYLITGGLGGLGLIFAREITRKMRTAKLILTGRSSISKDQQAILEAFCTTGNRVEYKQMDVSNNDEVKVLIQNLSDEYGSLNGIIHSAGVIFDNFILKKSTTEFKQVLAPKVSGCINIDEATKDQNLDFFVLFSSGTGVVGNPGQADYATGNAFMDRFAFSRNKKVIANERNGQTLSINWPLWKEGGMGLGAEAEKMFSQNTGMVPLESETGIMAFYNGLVSKHGQLLVMEGHIKQMRSLFFNNDSIQEKRKYSVKSQPVSELELTKQSMLKEKAVELIKRLLSSTLKLSVNIIDTAEPLDKYGIDSVLAMNMIYQLEKTFGSLPKTLFFEYQTINELTQYFMESYEKELREILHVDDFLEPEPKFFEKSVSLKKSHRHIKRGRFVESNESFLRSNFSSALDIAIIGISGRYPQSKDIEEYWTNLQNGNDCIIEVPKERWDWQQYYTE